jgi:putative DNA primase/helicase
MTKRKPPPSPAAFERAPFSLLTPEELSEINIDELETPPKRKRKRNGKGNGQHIKRFGDVLTVPLSDDALALALVDRYGGELRFVAMWNRWLRLSTNLCTWRFEETLVVFDMARAICREAYRSHPVTEHAAPRLTSGKTVAAVVMLARVDRRVAAVVQQWDADQWLLNTPEGAIDLRAGGELRPRPEAYCTKATAVAPGGGCPLWLKFLDRVTAGDSELQAFLQRMAGYCLTGSTQEHALFFLHGTGANGKTVFNNTLSGVLGDYATTAPMETFTESKQERHPTDLAGLLGARLVTATETEDGRRWAEAKLKQLTGGDRISARFMRQDFFQFTPQFKLLISGNHKPGLRGVDEAIRRRMNMIPFTVTIPEGERDPKLAEKLKAEWSGILQWAIDGFHAWLEQGLAPPESVRAATEAYLEAEDALNAWIEESCERDRSAWESSSALFASWKAWAERSGEFVGSKKCLGENLDARGFVPKKVSGARGFFGLSVIKPAESRRPIGTAEKWLRTVSADALDASSAYRRSRARAIRPKQGGASNASTVGKNRQKLKGATTQ